MGVVKGLSVAGKCMPFPTCPFYELVKIGNVQDSDSQYSDPAMYPPHGLERCRGVLSCTSFKPLNQAPQVSGNKCVHITYFWSNNGLIPEGGKFTVFWDKISAHLVDLLLKCSLSPQLRTRLRE